MTVHVIYMRENKNTISKIYFATFVIVVIRFSRLIIKIKWVYEISIRSPTDKLIFIG